MKHTPGPWTIRPDCVTIQGNSKLYVADCRVSSDYRSDEETKANARLIVKSPELVEALQEFVHLVGNTYHLIGYNTPPRELTKAVALLKEIS